MQAVYDAKKKALKWGFYPILSVATFGVSMVSAIKISIFFFKPLGEITDLYLFSV